MAPIAARHLAAITTNTRQVLAIELLAAYFALHHRRPLTTGPGLEAASALIAEHAAPPGEDRYFKEEVDAIAGLIESGALIAAVEDAVGPLARGPV